MTNSTNTLSELAAGIYQPHVSVAIKKLHEDAFVPSYGTEGAAGADLAAVIYPEDYPDGTPPAGQEALPIKPGERRLVKTGIAIELPIGYEAQCRPRSGLALKHGITVLNAPGTIDSDYRGEIGVILHNTSEKVFYVNPGDRIAQLVIAPVTKGQFIEADDLSDTVRGEGGYGSTGV